MCMICVDYQKGLLTASEAQRNMGEMVADSGHQEEIKNLIRDTEERRVIDEFLRSRKQALRKSK